MADTTPVTVFAGLRGTGKSTILNRLLHQQGSTGTAVLVNETGQIAVDHASIRRFDTKIGILKGGCPCCSGQNDLSRALRELLARARRGEITRVLIEATGLIDPAPILACFGSDLAIASAFHLESFIAVVDAATGMSRRMLHPWAVRQIAVADRIIISKTDKGDVGAFRNRLTEWNATQAIVESACGDVRPDDVFGYGLPNIGRCIAPRFTNSSTDEIIDLAGAPSNDIEQFQARIRTLHWTFQGPRSWPRFSAALGALVATYGDHILCVRGVVNCSDSSVPLLLHAVGHRVQSPVPLKSQSKCVVENSHVVIVIDDIVEPALANLKQALYAAGNESRRATLPSS